jgi:hypothetical protein
MVNVTVSEASSERLAGVAVMLNTTLSLSVMVPMAVSVSSTSALLLVRLTVKASEASRTASSVMATLMVRNSPAAPVKLRVPPVLS